MRRFIRKQLPTPPSLTTSVCAVSHDQQYGSADVTNSQKPVRISTRSVTLIGSRSRGGRGRMPRFGAVNVGRKNFHDAKFHSPKIHSYGSPYPMVQQQKSTRFLCFHDRLILCTLLSHNYASDACAMSINNLFHTCWRCSVQLSDCLLWHRVCRELREVSLLFVTQVQAVSSKFGGKCKM